MPAKFWNVARFSATGVCELKGRTNKTVSQSTSPPAPPNSMLEARASENLERTAFYFAGLCVEEFKRPSIELGVRGGLCKWRIWADGLFFRRHRNRKTMFDKHIFRSRLHLSGPSSQNPIALVQVLDACVVSVCVTFCSDGMVNYMLTCSCGAVLSSLRSQSVKLCCFSNAMCVFPRDAKRRQKMFPKDVHTSWPFPQKT